MTWVKEYSDGAVCLWHSNQHHTHNTMPLLCQFQCCAAKQIRTASKNSVVVPVVDMGRHVHTHTAESLYKYFKVRLMFSLQGLGSLFQ